MNKLGAIGIVCGLMSISAQAELASQLGRQFETPLKSESVAYAHAPDEQPKPFSENPDDLTFVLKEAHIKGVPDDVDLHTLLKPLYTKKVSFETLTRLAKEMTRFLRNEGYLLSQVLLPPQKVKEGSVEFVVINGFIDQVVYEGDEGVLDEGLKSLLERNQNKRPLDLDDLERALLLVARTPGVDIKVVFKASESKKEATDMVVVVHKDWGSVSVGVDNKTRRELGPFQVNASMVLNNLFDDYGQINIMGAKSLDGNKMWYVGMSYEVPINEEGLMFVAQGQVSQANPSGILRRLKKKNQYESMKAGVTYPFIMGRHGRLMGEMFFNMVKNDSQTRLIGGRNVDRLRFLEGHMTYDFADHMGGVNIWKLSVSKGLSGVFGASDNKSSRMIRSRSRFDFFKANIELMRTQDVMEGLSLLMHVEGQLATHTLPSSQRYYFGGSSLNHGYEMSVQGADSAINGTIGLSHQIAHEWGVMRLYTNLSHGYGWIRRPAADEKHHCPLASMDVGMDHQIKGLEGVQVKLSYGHPLKKKLFGVKAKARFYIGLSMNW